MAARSRHCHCLCSHNHPERLGVCTGTGYTMMLAEEGRHRWPDAPVCRRCSALVPELAPPPEPAHAAV
jgi:hypothetical protein